MVKTVCFRGFPGSSAGKDSACSTGDPSSIPGSGWSPGEGIGYPLQYSWASLVAQLVKTPPAMWETWVQSLDWKDPLEEGMATHSSILAWRIPWTEAPGGLETTGSQRVGHDWATKLTVCFILCEFYHGKQHLKKHIYVLREEFGSSFFLIGKKQKTDCRWFAKDTCSNATNSTVDQSVQSAIKQCPLFDDVLVNGG